MAKNKKKGKGKWIFLGMILIIGIGIYASGGNKPHPTSSTARPTSTPRATAVPRQTSAPTASPRPTSTPVPAITPEKAAFLPTPDAQGKTTYSGQVGWLFDSNGNALKNSFFDEAVIQIKEIPGVTDAAISVQPGRYYDTISIALTVNAATNEATAKDIADSAVRRIGSLFAMLDEYEGPSQKSFGTLFDEYSLTVGVYTSAGKTIVIGAAAKGTHRLTW